MFDKILKFSLITLYYSQINRLQYRKRGPLQSMKSNDSEFLLKLPSNSIGSDSSD